MRIPFLSLRRCFSPVAGIQWVETTIAFLAMLYRFSPVAGIQWVETFHHKSGIAPVPLVSVPLPGFSGLRLMPQPVPVRGKSFSPVAGIQWVETRLKNDRRFHN